MAGLIMVAALVAILFLLWSDYRLWINEELNNTQESLSTQVLRQTQAVAASQAVMAPAAVSALQRELYPVAKVVDGDTIDVIIAGTKERIRLLGINTPEVVDPRKPVQCYGKEASQQAHLVLDGKQVSLEADSTQGDSDKYGRLLRYVFLEDGSDFNEYMLSEGFAYEYTYNKPYKYQSEFRQAKAVPGLPGRVYGRKMPVTGISKNLFRISGY